jgi:hypothetical protein
VHVLSVFKWKLLDLKFIIEDWRFGVNPTWIKLLEKISFVGNKVTASGNKCQLEESFRAVHSFRGFKQLFWQIMLHNIKYKSSNQFDVYFPWVVHI